MIVYDSGSKIGFFPMGMAYLASAIRRMHPDADIEVWQQDIHHYKDSDLTDKLNENDYSVVMLSIIGGCYQYNKLLSLSQAINASVRRKDFVYMIGGHGPASDPEYYMKVSGADIVGIGEGEISIPRVIDAIKNGRGYSDIPGISYRENERVIYNPRQSLIKDVDSIDWPAWDLFEMNSYALKQFPRMAETERCAVILSGRGCIFECNFCYRMDKGFRPRSTDSILAEMKYLKKTYDITFFYFGDELLVNSEKRVLDFCDSLRKEKMDIHWWCNGRLNFANDKVISAMRDAGCVFINYGIESMDEETRIRMNKHLTQKQIYSGIETTLKYGISPGLNFIYGNIGEPISAIEKDREFMETYDDHAQLNRIHLVIPFPGTPLYDHCVREGLIKDTADFYENKHKDYDHLVCNLTEHSDIEIYSALRDANMRLVNAYYKSQTGKYQEIYDNTLK